MSEINDGDAAKQGACSMCALLVDIYNQLKGCLYLISNGAMTSGLEPSARAERLLTYTRAGPHGKAEEELQ